MEQSEVAAKAEVCSRNLRGTKRYIEKDGSREVEEKVREEY